MYFDACKVQKYPCSIGKVIARPWDCAALSFLCSQTFLFNQSGFVRLFFKYSFACRLKKSVFSRMFGAAELPEQFLLHPSTV